MLQKKAQTYNDGVCTIYSVGNIAGQNETQLEGLAKKVGPLRFENRTVGTNRFWTAMHDGVKIDRLIRTPRLDGVDANDVAVLHDGKQYTIKQVQYPQDVMPLSMDLSLETLTSEYPVKADVPEEPEP